MFSYSVAIRTIGKAGEKYLETLKSIDAQTIRPTNIYVYLPVGYAHPRETIGKEVYIYCEKGMVAQRALQYTEIKDDWILFLDDDVSLPPHFIEHIVAFMDNNDTDVVVSDVFDHSYSVKSILIALGSGALPMLSKIWGNRVSLSGRFFYNLNPQSNFLKTNTGSGICSLCRKLTFINSHFEDERWLDDWGYALGDDQLFHYKMYLNGASEYVYYNSGVRHLDAGREQRLLDETYIRRSSACFFLIWYRSIFEPSHGLRKILSLLCFIFSLLLRFLFSFSYVLKGLFGAPISVIRGTIDAVNFVHTAQYKSYKPFV